MKNMNQIVDRYENFYEYAYDNWTKYNPRFSKRNTLEFINYKSKKN